MFINNFLNYVKKNIVTQLSDNNLILLFAFLVTITKYLNKLNLKLQEQGKSIANLYFGVKAFVVKLCLYGV